MQTENLYFFSNLSAISDFEGEIGGFSQKMREIQNIFGKKVGLIGC